MRSAVVLAGGYSTRFGERDKATTDSDGDPLVRRVVTHIKPAVDEVIVNCRREQREAIADALDGTDSRFAFDPVPGGDPVAGIRTGCRVARGRWTFVTACDMPFVRADLIDRLFDRADADAVVPRIDGRLRPLAAVYHTETAIDACDTTLGVGSSSLQELVARLSAVTVRDAGPARAVEDVDTRSALQAAESRNT